MAPLPFYPTGVWYMTSNYSHYLNILYLDFFLLLHKHFYRVKDFDLKEGKTLKVLFTKNRFAIEKKQMKGTEIGQSYSSKVLRVTTPEKTMKQISCLNHC